MPRRIQDGYAKLRKITRDNPDWELLYNKVGQDVLLVELAYEDNKQTFAAIAPHILHQEQDLFSSYDFQEFKKANYQCVFVIDSKNKKITFANAGSRYTPFNAVISDLADGIRMFFGYQPVKATKAFELNLKILELLGDEAMNYDFCYSGHSQGATIADMAAAHMDIELRKRNLKQDNSKQITSTTFENLGSKIFLDQMYKKAEFSYENDKDITLNVFNNRANPINSLYPQAGNTYIILPNEQKPLAETYFSKFCGSLSNIFSKASMFFHVSKVFHFLEIGLFQLQKDHAFANFNEVLVQHNGIFMNDSGEIITLEPSIAVEVSINNNFEIEALGYLSALFGD